MKLAPDNASCLLPVYTVTHGDAAEAAADWEGAALPRGTPGTPPIT